MKKLLLSGLALTFGLAAVAQRPTSATLQDRLSPTISNKSAHVIKPSDVYQAPVVEPNPTVYQSRASMVEVGIGTTHYDLQANYGSPGQRIYLWSDNTISAIWTFAATSATPPASAADRGTGYNYFDGSSWGAFPTARVESYKTGFSSLGCSDALGEVIVNHGDNSSLGATCSTSTNKIMRATKGSGTWSESPLSCLSVIWWPRVAVGGANGTTIFALGNDNAPTSLLNFSRSTDGGANWVDENIALPNFANDVFEGPVDAYQVVSRGDVVAIVMGGWMESLILWKSTDNGANWTETIINQFPLAPFAYSDSGAISDITSPPDGIADTILTVDSGIALAIDNNNQVHVAVGLMRVLDDDPGAGSSLYSYFPGTDGLLYWNESMPAGDITSNVVAAIEEIDGLPGVTMPDGLAIYQCSLTGQPTLGVDANNNIHLVYSSIVEGTSNGNPDPALEEAFRNVYAMHSTDGGTNWSTPARIESDDFAEQAWPSMAATVNSKIHLVYHKDGEPGDTYQASDAGVDPFVTVDVIYNDVTNPVGVAEINSPLLSTVVYPNPVLNVMNVDFNLENAQNMSISLVDVLGQTVYTTDIKGHAGINNFSLNVRNYTSGVYSLNTTVGNNIFSEKVVIQ